MNQRFGHLILSARWLTGAFQHIEVPEILRLHSLVKGGHNFSTTSNTMHQKKQALAERLFKQHAGGLSAFFVRRVRNQADASALAQEVYLRFLRVGDIDAIRNPEAYLYSVASNLASEQRILDARRGISVNIEDPSIQQQLKSIDEPSSEVDREHRSARLQEVLRQLSPKCRAAIVLQYWHGLSYQEIADQLQVSTHMVKKYISQGLSICRRRMARLG